MSKTVDERVVEMRFDNKQFETNVQTSMSTLDKLKQKLNLSDSAKSLEKVEDASRKINMSGLSGAVETVSAKFSALQVVGITALANITNSAVNAGKRIVSALTIDPVKTGFNEYELKMDSVKTIIASTGEPIEKVNRLLNELNKYSDETIYSFSDMTQNIGKFTNAGVKLEDAVMAIKGISNEAAVSGANANEASRAMYNFAQALSAGHVKLIDWKSIELANMATKEFKEQLINSAVSAGTLTKTADGMYKTLSGNTLTATQNFNETLQDQWMTTDVLINTLKDYADETTEIGAKAKAAAQDVTKFSQMFDILKETAQSGWAATWELIFGDINQAKKIFTPLTEFLSNIINKMSDFRNNLLEGALGSPLGKLVDKISNVTAVTGTAVEKMQDYSDIVNRVINGEFGNAEQRWNKLTEMGYNWAHVQNLVNEKLGNSYRRTVDLTDAQGEQTKQTIELTDAKLRELGLTDDEIKQYRDLEKAAKAAGMTIDEYIASMNKKTGRELLIEAITNAGKGLVKVFSAIKNAWTEIFPPATSQQLYNIIEGINKFSKKLVMSDETADKVKRTFKGLFAILDMVRTILGGAFSIAFKVAKLVLGAFGLDILDVTAYIGDAIVKVRDWIKEHDLIGKAISTVVPFIANIISKIVEWVKSTEILQNGLVGLKSGLSSAWQAISQWFAGLREADNIPKYIFEGLVNGLKSGISKVVETVGPLAQKIIDVVKKVLGIASPSKVFFAIGGFIIAGLIGGIKAFLPGLWDTLSGFVSNITDFFEGINWGTVFAVGMSASSILVANKIATGIKGIGEMFAGAGKIMSKAAKPIKKILKNTANVVDSFSKVLNGVSWKLKAEAFKAIAVSIAIVVAAIIAMTFVDTDKLWNSVKVIGALAVIMMLLVASVNSMAGGSKDLKSGAVNIAKIGGILLSIGAAILLIAIAMKILGKLSPAQYEQGIIAIGVILTGMAGLIYVLGKTSSNKNADAQIESIGKTMRKLAVSLLIMVVVIKLLGKMDTGTLIKGEIAVAALGGIIVGLMWAVKKFGKDAKNIGRTLLTVAGAIAILAIMAIILGKTDVGTLIKGEIAVAALGGIIVGLMWAVKKFGKDAKNIGKTILMITGAIAILAMLTIILGIVDTATLAKGISAVTILAAMMAVLIKATKDAKKVVGTIVALTVAIAVLAAAVFILSQMDPVGVAVGAAAMSAVMAVMALLLKTAKSAKKAIKTIIAITVAIVLIAAALCILAGLPADSVLASSLALSAVLLALIGSMTMISKARSLSAKAIASLAVMLAVMIGIGDILYILGSVPVESAIASAAALSIVLLALSASMILISKFGSMSMSAMAAVALMGLVIAALGKILYNLAQLPVESVMGVALVLLALSASMILISKFGSMSMSAMAAVALMGLVIAALGKILYNLAQLPVESVMGVALALSVLLGAFTVALGVLTLIGLGGPAALIGIGALVKLIEGLGIVVVALGVLSSAIPDLKQFLDEGIVILQKIGEAIGAFAGGIVDGFLSAATESLPEVGLKLSQFAINATPFITTMKLVDGQTLEGASILALAICEFAIAQLVDGIAKLLGLSLPELGLELTEFSRNVRPFILNMGTIDSDAAAGAKALAETILILTASNLINGIADFLGLGSSSISDFGAELVPFGEYLNQFSQKVAGIDGASVKVAAEAGKTLAEMADTVPNENGIIGFFAGEKSLAKFGTEIVTFGESLADFDIAVRGINPETITTAAEAGKALAEMADKVPNRDGVIGFFAGENSLANFGTEIVTFGESLRDFGTAVENITPDKVKAAAEAGKALAEMADTVPNQDGLVSFFAGDNSLASFSEEIVEFGGAMSDLSDAVGENFKIGKVRAAVEAGKVLASIAASDADYDVFEDMSDNIALFATVIKTLSEKIINVDTDKLSIKAKTIKQVMDDFSDMSADGMVSFIKAISESEVNSKGAFSNIMDAMAKVADEKKDTFIDTGKKIAGWLASGVSDKTTLATKIAPAAMAITNIITNSVGEKQGDFRGAGKSAVQGFANGIDYNLSLATYAGKAMAKAAKDAAMKELDAHSPSKEFETIGTYVPMGFANGVDKLAYLVTDASKNMTSTAMNSTRKAISRIADVVNSDIDSRPTIRPVLDLSDVANGAGAINRMLSMSPSVGLMSSTGSIMYSMNKRQNGTTSDVISAINSLGKSLASSNGDTYNINGITYDDGSNVSDAIKTLIRAARIERRT